jgi:hypothetical protein
MGMDFYMIMGHELNSNQIQDLIQDDTLWNPLANYFKNEINYRPLNPYRKWTQEPTQENLNNFWQQIETQGYCDRTIEIDCYFGRITIFRKTLKVWFSTIFYSYSFFENVIDTMQIINVGRIFANYIGTNKVLYVPDGYRKTAIIADYACKDLTLDEAILKGINEFGRPPKGLSKGRKNYFFVDYVNEEIGEIKEWAKEEDFWIWDEDEKEYLQIKQNKAYM